MAVDFNDAVRQGGDLMQKALSDYSEQMREAYLKAGDEPLDVTVKLRFAPDRDGMKVKASISFVESRVKEDFEIMLNGQVELFKGE